MNFKPWNSIQGIPSLSNPPKSLPKGGNNMGSKKKAKIGKITKINISGSKKKGK